jgi:uncharacterized RDD family membrane protein YckC
MKSFEYFLDVVLLIALWVAGLLLILSLIFITGEVGNLRYPNLFMLVAICSVLSLLTAYTLNWKKRYNKK